MVAHKSEHPTHTEWFLTGVPAPSQQTGAGASASAVFRGLAERLAAERISVMHERIYCLGRGRDEILAQRAAALEETGLAGDWPVTVLEGAPASGDPFGGVQLWGVAVAPGSDHRIETVTWDDGHGRVAGREWSGPDFRALLLTGVDGATATGVDAATPTGDAAPEQARRMFQRAGAALAARHFEFQQVARTWIYLPRILDWYGEFNRVRSVHYAQAGLTAAGAAPFPASTGIQARRDDEACSVDLLAIATATSSPRIADGLVVRPLLRSSRQGQAASYGSAFARAMVLDRGGKKIIHVSGTASIDADGNSTHAGDVAAQHRDTLLSIGALLEQEGGALTDIVQGTRFVKEAAAARACDASLRWLGLPALPLIDVVADVCRPELLVEIEAIAIV